MDDRTAASKSSILNKIMAGFFLTMLMAGIVTIWTLQKELQKKLGNIGLDSGMVSEVTSFFIIRSVAVSIIAIGAAVLIAYLMSRSISNPIIKLQKSAEEISKGNLDNEIKTSSDDEIGELAKSFEKMRREVKSSREDLQNKVKEKTRELTEKVEDLEKIQDLTSDSEIYAEGMRIEKESAFKKIKMLEKELNRLKSRK